MENNPEQELIDLIASEIEEDEKILDGLGGGTLSLEDLERWRAKRWESDRRFMVASRRHIADMHAKGFGRMMSGSRRQTFGQSYRRTARVPARRASPRKKTPPARAASAPHHFSLAMSDLGLPCSMRIIGAYEEVLEIGSWHARRVHHLKGSPSSVRDTVKSAIVEEQVSPVSAEERTHGLRGEEQVSDEARNQTRSGFSWPAVY